MLLALKFKFLCYLQIVFQNLRIQYPTILPLKFISLEEGKTYAAAGSSKEPVEFLACVEDSSRPQRSRIHSNLRSSGEQKKKI